MTNPWISHVKNYSRQHNISYSAALSDPKCSQSYQRNSNSGSGIFGSLANAVGRVSGNVVREGKRGYSKGSK